MPYRVYVLLLVPVLPLGSVAAVAADGEELQEALRRPKRK